MAVELRVVWHLYLALLWLAKGFHSWLETVDHAHDCLLSVTLLCRTSYSVTDLSSANDRVHRDSTQYRCSVWPVIISSLCSCLARALVVTVWTSFIPTSGLSGITSEQLNSPSWVTLHKIFCLSYVTNNQVVHGTRHTCTYSLDLIF